MIDIETPVFDAVYRELLLKYEGILLCSEHVNVPASFPCVMLYESSNTTFAPTWDEQGEHHAEVRYTVEVYANDVNGKKSRAKAIAQDVDRILLGMGFTRASRQYSFGANDSPIFAVSMNYQGVAGESPSASPDEIMIYRR